MDYGVSIIGVFINISVISWQSIVLLNELGSWIT